MLRRRPGKGGRWGGLVRPGLSLVHPRGAAASAPRERGSGALPSGGWRGSAAPRPRFGKSGCPFTSHPDLQIYAVTPIPDYVDVLQMDRVPDRVKSFYRVNNVRKFRYDRPFHKGPKDKENEFKVNKPRRAGAVLTARPGQGPLSWDVVPVSSVEQAGCGRNRLMACTDLCPPCRACGSSGPR